VTCVPDSDLLAEPDQDWAPGGGRPGGASTRRRTRLVTLSAALT